MCNIRTFLLKHFGKTFRKHPIHQVQQQTNPQATNQQTPQQDQEKNRFIAELEFVQCLANPNYICFLAQNGYFKKPEFINYMEYLKVNHM